MSESGIDVGVAVRPLHWPGDQVAVQRVDATFTTHERARPVLDSTGLRIAYEALAEPLTKRQPMPVTDGNARPWQQAWVAEMEGRIVGVAGTHRVRWNDRQVLDALYVDASARRRGVGRALVTAALAAATGARQLWLETQDVNAPAVRAYQALGFTLVGLDTTLYGPPYAHETALYLARPLRPPG